VTYTVKEIFYTLQGEGANVGRPAAFLRFAGCNLWSGRESDRRRAICKFCDTDFRGGQRFRDAEALADAVAAVWLGDPQHRFVVVTGGEPALQFDAALARALKERHFFIAIETNGTVPLKGRVDWITVSPKAGTDPVLRGGDELKLVFPQEGAPPDRFEDLAFRLFYLQPMDDSQRQTNTLAALDYCRRHPRWRLSLQTHKLVGFP